MSADRLMVYRLVAVDIDILEEVARDAMAHGHPDWASKLRGVIDRAHANPYNEDEDVP